MAITARRLNRATLARQLLLRREPLGVPDGLRRVVAVQAQEPASPYLALWNRLRDFDPAELDAAFADRTVVKATLVRITLHAVHTDDYPAFHHAMVDSLRRSRLHDRRFHDTGRTIDEVDAIADTVLAFVAEPRTNAEVEAWLGEQGGRVWWALRTFLPVHHAPTGAPWTFGQRPAYRAAAPRPEPSEDATQQLIRRYLEGFGPATVLDVAQFSLLRRPVIRAALDSLGDELVRLDNDLWDVPGGPVPDEDVPAPPRLMAMWDSVLLAYADRSRVIPPPHRNVVIRRNGDVLPTLLVDGYVAGVWRPVDDGIEATALAPLTDADWDGLDAEARALRTLLADRDPQVYRRYVRDWPQGEVRILGR